MHLSTSFFWLIIIATIIAIAVLTYFYSGKNRYLTAWVTLVAGLALLCAVGYDTWELYLQNNFVGRIDALGVPYRYSRAGWLILVDAWPLWAVPTVFFTSIVAGLIFYLRKTSVEQIESQASSVTVRASSDHVVKHLEVDMLKRALATANERLAQALIARGREEAKAHGLQEKLRELGQDQLQRLQNKVQLLELDVAAKQREVDYLSKG